MGKKRNVPTTKRNCDNCGKEYEADNRNLKRGWGLCCSKSCAASKREKESQIEARRKESLDKVEQSYNDPQSKFYRDNERYKWAVEVINSRYNNKLNPLRNNEQKKTRTDSKN